MCGILNQHGDHPGLDGQFVGIDEESAANLFDDTYDAAKGPECERSFVSIEDVAEEDIHPDWIAMTQVGEENLDEAEIVENEAHERHREFDAIYQNYLETVNALRGVHLEYVLLDGLTEEEYLKVTGCRPTKLTPTNDREGLENLPKVAGMNRDPGSLGLRFDPWLKYECVGKITVHDVGGMKPKWRCYRRSNACGRHGRKQTLQSLHRHGKVYDVR